MAFSRRIRCLDDFGQLQRGSNRRDSSFPFNGSGNLFSKFFLAIGKEDMRQLLLGQRIHQISRRPAVLTHPHIERRFVMIRKPPFSGIELVRRYADIQQYAIHGRHR